MSVLQSILTCDICEIVGKIKEFIESEKEQWEGRQQQQFVENFADLKTITSESLVEGNWKCQTCSAIRSAFAFGKLSPVDLREFFKKKDEGMWLHSACCTHIPHIAHVLMHLLFCTAAERVYEVQALLQGQCHMCLIGTLKVTLLHSLTHSLTHLLTHSLTLSLAHSHRTSTANILPPFHQRTQSQ